MSSTIKYMIPYALGGVLFCMVLLQNHNLFGQYGAGFESGTGPVEVGIGSSNPGFGVTVGDSSYGVGNGFYNGYNTGYDFDYGPSVGYDRYRSNYSGPKEVGPHYNGYYYEPLLVQY